MPTNNPSPSINAPTEPLQGKELVPGPKFSELFSMTTKLGDWVNTIWAVHSGVSLAILGWWVSKSLTWTSQEKAWLTVVYVFLMTINLYSQIRAHRWLDAFVVELKAVAAKTQFESETLHGAIRRLKTTRYWILYLWHVAVDAFVLAVVWRWASGGSG